MNSHDIVVRIDRKGLVLVAALIVVGSSAGLLWSESLTLVTTYPSPSGIYNMLVTTGNSGTVPANTVLNRNAGNTILVPSTNFGGKVGIGTTNPASRLEVAGTVTVENLQVTAVAAAGAACPVNGLVAREPMGALLSCQSGVWARGLQTPLETSIVTGPESACRGYSTADCPSGYVVVGGGHQFVSSCGCSENHRFSGVSKPAGNGWTGFIECATSITYAVCAR